MGDSRAIGVFDSGLGGLTVAKRIMELMPEERIVYFGDTGRVPYGTKGVSTIKKYAVEDERFLISQNVKMIVAACGTVSAVAADTGKELPVPFVEVISHSVKDAVSVTKNKKIGVLGTPATIKSHAHKKLIEKLLPDALVIETAAPLLVSLAEEGWYTPDNEVARLTAEKYLDEMKSAGVDTIILGCTHFPVFKELFSRLLPDVILIDMGASAAKYIKDTLEKSGAVNTGGAGEHKFFASDKPVTFEKVVKIFLRDNGGDIKIDLVDVEKNEKSND
ncbi:MAG: glutamate racemase [Clostridia bacterium]|nr:glutamate racemase [Clostridia bacterium]